MRRLERQGVALSIKDRPAELEPLPGLWRLKLFFFKVCHILSNYRHTFCMFQQPLEWLIFKCVVILWL